MVDACDFTPWNGRYTAPVYAYPVYTYNLPRCPGCGGFHSDECKRKVRAIEYHDNGQIKRVEYEPEDK